MSAQERERLFAIAALARELIGAAEFGNRYGQSVGRDEQGLINFLIANGRLTLDEARCFSDLLDHRLFSEQRRILEQLIVRNARLMLPKICDERALDVLNRWIEESSAQIQQQRPQSLNQRGIDRYQLVQLHQEGGMGQVWEAMDPALRRVVAIKRLKSNIADNADARRRLRREAIITAQLEHPSIVPVHEIGLEADGDSPYFAMRLLSGQTLRQEIRNYHASNANETDARRGLRRLLGHFIAVAFAHSRGVIHRDLKPENVFVGAFGDVVLLDWGLAKLIDNDGISEPSVVDHECDANLQQTMAGSRVGTPGYMAPEQASGDLKHVNRATDVYGLGAILFEIVANAPPHPVEQAESRSAFFRGIVEAPTPHAASVRPAVEPALDAICAKAMAKNPRDRYPTASLLAEDIERSLAGEPVSAYPEPLLRKLARGVAARPLLSSIVAWFAIVSILFAAVLATATIAEQQEIRLVSTIDLDQQGRRADIAIQEKLLHCQRDVEFVSGLEQTTALLRSNPPATAAAPELSALRQAIARDEDCVQLGLVSFFDKSAKAIRLTRQADSSIRTEIPGSLPTGSPWHSLAGMSPESNSEPSVWYTFERNPRPAGPNLVIHIAAAVHRDGDIRGYVWQSFDFEKLMREQNRWKRLYQTNIITDADGRILEWSAPSDLPTPLQSILHESVTWRTAAAEREKINAFLNRSPALFEFLRTKPPPPSLFKDPHRHVLVASGTFVAAARQIPLSAKQRLGMISVLDLSHLRVGPEALRNSLIGALIAVLVPATALSVLGWLFLRHLRRIP